MTEAEYDSKIAENRQAVTGYQQEIGKLEEEIRELKTFRTELCNLQDVLHDTASRAEGQINGITGLVGRAVSAVSQNFFLYNTSDSARRRVCVCGQRTYRLTGSNR